MEENDYIYVVNEYGKFIRKIVWKGKPTIIQPRQKKQN